MRRTLSSIALAVALAACTHETPTSPLRHGDVGLVASRGKTKSYAQNLWFPDSGAGVHVYIVDTGIRGTHIEFTGRMGGGIDVVHDGLGTDDCNGHGTYIAGIVGGATRGIANKVTLHPVRIFGCNSVAPSDSVIAALRWIITNGQKPGVIEVAFEGDTSTTEEPVIQEAIDSGFTVVVAAGNTEKNTCLISPERMSAVLTVAGENSNYWWVVSGSGACVDFEAPVFATAAYFTSDSAFISLNNGTSQSSAQVAGAAALYLGEHPASTPVQVTSYLQSVAALGVVINVPPNTPNALIEFHNTPPRR